MRDNTIAVYDTGGNAPSRGVEVFIHLEEGHAPLNVRFPMGKEKLIKLATDLLVMAGRSSL